MSLQVNEKYKGYSIQEDKDMIKFLSDNPPLFQSLSYIMNKNLNIPTLDKSIAIMSTILERIIDPFSLSVEAYKVKNENESNGWIYVKSKSNPCGVTLTSFLDIKQKVIGFKVTNRTVIVFKIDPILDSRTEFFKTFGLLIEEVFPGCDEKLVKFALVVFTFLNDHSEILKNITKLIKCCAVTNYNDVTNPPNTNAEIHKSQNWPVSLEESHGCDFEDD